MTELYPLLLSLKCRTTVSITKLLTDQAGTTVFVSNWSSLFCKAVNSPSSGSKRIFIFRQKMHGSKSVITNEIFMKRETVGKEEVKA